MGLGDLFGDYLLDGDTMKIAISLGYALRQVKNETERRLVAQEFWHSLNRKALIPNERVETLIQETINI